MEKRAHVVLHVRKEKERHLPQASGPQKRSQNAVPVRYGESAFLLADQSCETVEHSLHVRS